MPQQLCQLANNCTSGERCLGRWLSMRSDVAQPFLLAAKGVLEQELGGAVGRGQVTVERGDFEAGEVTAVVGVTGQLSGAILYRMSEATALAVVGQMMGQRFNELDALARRGGGEVGEV